ncbi:MAG: hypothetical protein FJW34_02055 [Acidobacteria bacterium]|nr:hypothetical protein [Acidobacteriota bacterium]
MSNVLSEAKKNQVIALGRLGWSLRRIQRATGVRRETAAAYLRAAGVDPRPPGRWGRQPPAKPAMEVTPDPGSGSRPAIEVTARGCSGLAGTGWAGGGRRAGRQVGQPRGEQTATSGRVMGIE